MESADETPDAEATIEEADDEATDDPEDACVVPIAWTDAEAFTEVLDSDMLLLALFDLALDVTSDFFSSFLLLTFAFSSGSYNVIVIIDKK